MNAPNHAQPQTVAGAPQPHNNQIVLNIPPQQPPLVAPIEDMLPQVPDRFELIKKLGQGTFSYIYEAIDKKLSKNVALKIEKRDKNKNILYFEYEVLKQLAGLNHVCETYDFIKTDQQNFIVMQLEGPNLTRIKRTLDSNFILRVATKLLLQMLEAIEQVHNRGFIHRDVKASNFVLSKDKKNVYIVDFGLAKQHLKRTGQPVAQRRQADFRGTVSFASLNAHNGIDLSRRDDLWSFYFVLLDFYNESLKWREQKNLSMNEVRDIKERCLSQPQKLLWRTTTKNMEEVHKIFWHLKELKYKDKPNYDFIREQLLEILKKELTRDRYSNNPPILRNPGPEIQNAQQQPVGSAQALNAQGQAINNLKRRQNDILDLENEVKEGGQNNNQGQQVNGGNSQFNPIFQTSIIPQSFDQHQLAQGLFPQHIQQQQQQNQNNGAHPNQVNPQFLNVSLKRIKHQSQTAKAPLTLSHELTTSTMVETQNLVCGSVIGSNDSFQAAQSQNLDPLQQQNAYYQYFNQNRLQKGMMPEYDYKLQIFVAPLMMLPEQQRYSQLQPQFGLNNNGFPQQLMQINDIKPLDIGQVGQQVQNQQTGISQQQDFQQPIQPLQFMQPQMTGVQGITDFQQQNNSNFVNNQSNQNVIVQQQSQNQTNNTTQQTAGNQIITIPLNPTGKQEAQTAGQALPKKPTSLSSGASQAKQIFKIEKVERNLPVKPSKQFQLSKDPVKMGQAGLTGFQQTQQVNSLPQLQMVQPPISPMGQSQGMICGNGMPFQFQQQPGTPNASASNASGLLSGMPPQQQ